MLSGRGDPAIKVKKTLNTLSEKDLEINEVAPNPGVMLLAVMLCAVWSSMTPGFGAVKGKKRLQQESLFFVRKIGIQRGEDFLIDGRYVAPLSSVGQRTGRRLGSQWE